MRVLTQRPGLEQAANCSPKSSTKVYKNVRFLRQWAGCATQSSAATLLHRMIQPEDVGAFVQDCQNHEGELRFVVFDEGGGDAHDDEQCVADWIFPAERVHVGGAFQRGVPEVDDEAEAEYAEEPLAARHEVLFET